MFRFYRKHSNAYISLIVAFLVMLINITPIAEICVVAQTTFDDTEAENTADITQHKVTVSAENVDFQSSENIEIVSGWSDTDSVLTNEDSTAVFSFLVEHPGEYTISVKYAVLIGKDIAAERTILINDELLYPELNNYIFPLTWKDSQIVADSNGNDYIPDQYQLTELKDMLLYSGKGIQDEYRIFLSSGLNKITFISKKEKMIIGNIVFESAKELPDYADYLLENNSKPNSVLPDEKITIQAQNIYEKSDISVYPVNDRTSPLTFPSDLSKIRLNAIGGRNWKNIKQSISWEAPVEHSGFYKLNLRYKQDYNDGASSFRRLYVNGEVPFKEAAEIEFPYNPGWQMLTFGNNKPFQVYLEEGDNIITLEVVHGYTTSIYDKIRTVIVDLNELYRKIIMITSPSPDLNRDYNLISVIPGLMETFVENEEILNTAKHELLSYSDEKTQYYSLIETLQYQIIEFIENHNLIAKRLQAFSSNVSSLSISTLNHLDQPLLLDYFEFSHLKSETPMDDVNFFQRILHDIKSFMVSFFVDYDLIGQTDSSQKKVTLWLGGGTAGRDQANAIRRIINNYFTREQDIAVDIRLIDLNSMLPAVASGAGPDIAIAQDRLIPLNYGFRGAVYDLSVFDDCSEVLNNFPEAATIPFVYKDRVYGLPDSFVFPVMFYRWDILDELDLEIPETWDDVHELLPKLNNRNLQMGFPLLVMANVQNLSGGGLYQPGNNEMFYTFLFQKGGDVYNKEMDRAILDSDVSVNAFTQWANLYTKYSVTKSLDIFTRFRTGEAPIVIAPYTFYNMLNAVAPEIKGLWSMTSIPGTINEDGLIDKTTGSNGTASIMFTNAKDKDSSWEFLKWWTLGDTQQKYNRELEIILGASGRIAIAYNDSLDLLPWSQEEINVLKEQIEHVRGIPEVPGSYITQRYVSTAILLSVNNGVFPRQSITNYNRLINDEIKAKLIEFNIAE